MSTVTPSSTPIVAPLEVRSPRTEGATRRQFVRFAFYAMDPAWRQLDLATRESQRSDVVSLIEEMGERDGVTLRTYSLVGTRGDADWMVWMVSDGLEAFSEYSARLNQLDIAGYLRCPYHYFAMTKKSSYVAAHHHENAEGHSERLIMLPQARKYLFVYPFVKTRGWYHLSKEERQRQMTEHIEMGHRYPGVKINTTYSFGLDDQEFVVAFESDSVEDFLDLVQEMRISEASAHTVRDVPSFTCMVGDPASVLASL